MCNLSSEIDAYTGRSVAIYGRSISSKLTETLPSSSCHELSFLIHMTTAPPPQGRRIFGGALMPPQQSRTPSPSLGDGHKRSQSHSPRRTPRPTHSAGSSSQSLDPVAFSNNEDEQETNLACPICNENMITLLQLNQHLDDVHREVEEVRKETVKSWFKKRMMKAKSLPPVIALNQKFGKSEPFERNGDQQGAMGMDATIVTDEIVTKKHWQVETGNDYCSEPICGKPLNNKNGHVNCSPVGRALN
jgi:rabenosyn-5